MRKTLTRAVLGAGTVLAFAAPAAAQSAPLIEQPIKNVASTGLQWKNEGSGAAIGITGTGSGYTDQSGALVAGDGSCATWIQGGPMKQETCNSSEAQTFAWTSGGDMANEGASGFLGTGACVVLIRSNTALGAAVCPGQPVPASVKWKW